MLLVGIGTMICENRMEFRDEQVMGMMKQTVSDMVNGAKLYKELGEVFTLTDLPVTNKKDMMKPRLM